MIVVGSSTRLAGEGTHIAMNLTARTVAHACRTHGPVEVVGSGGGMGNPAPRARVLGRISPGHPPLRLPEPVGAVHALEMRA